MIADQSPPMTNMHASQEMYGLSNEHQPHFADENMSMSGMFPKHNMNFSVPTTMDVGGNTFDLPIQTLSNHPSPGVQGDYQSMTPLENVDPNTLAPGA
jgi:hypothetical protein